MTLAHVPLFPMQTSKNKSRQVSTLVNQVFREWLFYGSLTYQAIFAKTSVVVLCAKALYLCAVAASGCGLVPAQAAAAGNYTNGLWEARYDDLVMGQEHWGFPNIGVPLNHQF